MMKTYLCLCVNLEDTAAVVVLEGGIAAYFARNNILDRDINRKRNKIS